jgi:hypothetical protein
MPVHKATSKSGKNGYQWGNHGKVYTGAGAKEKAAAQGRAAHAAGYKSMNQHQKGRGK